MTFSFRDRHQTTIRIGAREYTGWKAASIAYGLETSARSFDLVAVAAREGLADGMASIPDLYVGDAVEILVGPETARQKLITGFIEVVAPSYDADNQEVSVQGRSRTCDVVDCVPARKRYYNATMSGIVTRLCNEYGIGAVFPSGLTDQVKRFAVEDGESSFEAIERLLRLKGVIIFDDADGNLVIQQTSPGSFPIDLGASLRRGENIKSGQAVFDGTRVFSEYVCKGQRAGNDFDFGEVVAGVTSTASDDGLGRTRRTEIVADSSLNSARAKRRAVWEAVTRLGRSCMVTYDIVGWFDQAGFIWQPGVNVLVQDDFLRIDRELLIISVNLAVDDDGGHITTLTCAPEAGYYQETALSSRRGFGGWRR